MRPLRPPRMGEISDSRRRTALPLLGLAMREIMSRSMFRTRFREQMVPGFLPPSRDQKAQNVVVLRDGMPSIPRRHWRKLRGGTFYSPRHHGNEVTLSEIPVFHAKDDPHVPYPGSRPIASTAGRLSSLSNGTDTSARITFTRKYWLR